VLVGCNYNASPEMQLYGCVNDALNMKNTLTRYFGFGAENIKLMTDDFNVTTDPLLQPTTSNILRELTNLTQGLKAGDLAVFQFSGHGLRYVDTSRDEADGRDEAILGTDARALLDDTLRPLIDNAAKTGVRLRIFMDSCHSGTVIDLPYLYADSGSVQRDGRTALASSNCNVLMISGCRDIQYSMDTYLEGMSQGAMSSFLQTVLETAAQSNTAAYKWTDVVKTMRTALKNSGYTQVPQLTFTQPALVNAMLDL